MKRYHSLSVVIFAAILILIPGIPYTSTKAVAQNCFLIEEYRLFHDVLHPLQHEALPRRDFPRIRLMAGELVTRGKGVLEIRGVPEAPKANRREFAKAWRTFDKALAKFKTNAKTGRDSRLTASFAAVHDSFETLADLVGSVYPPAGLPPPVSLDCPFGDPDSSVTINASTPEDPEKLLFTWMIDKGKILTGDGTKTITIDTTGLAGLTISVTLEVNDGCGHVMVANCRLKIWESKLLQ
jgi:hypothetical protein